MGDDEVGETGGNDEDAPNSGPLDPLAGGGGMPPSSPDPTKKWRPAVTFGNGLVHDSRLNRDEPLHQRNYHDTDLADGVPWSDFVGSYQAKTAVGFRPAQLRARVEATPTGNTTTQIAIVDDSVYIADDDANYQTAIETYLFGNVPSERNFASFGPAAHGARPISIDTFAIEDSGKVGYSVAWVYDDAAMPWMLLAGQSKDSMSSKLDELGAVGFRPIALASRKRNEAQEFAAILVQDETAITDFESSISLAADQVADAIQDQWDAGFYPMRVTGERGSSFLNVLWLRRPPGLSVQTRLNLTPATFESEDIHWRTRGYHLESVADYPSAGEPRQLAVWVRYEPYLRWHGTTFAANDVAYQTRYAMFHEQAIRTMSFATQVDCSGGQPCPDGTSCYACPDDDDAVCFHDHVCVESRFRSALRPSATLHVFEGTDLVLSRGYTFAPAVYATTPSNSPMKLAGVSKAITAAAIVREMAAHQLVLTTPFVTVAKIQNGPAVMTPVTVLDVLRDLGGFEREAKSYTNHTLIHDSIYGSIPIDGTEMFNYVVAGHLGAGGDDSYWESETYTDSQSTGTLVASDPGYSMVGQLARILSGSSYEQYVIDHLFTPLGLNQTCFSDPGHRVHARGPTLAGFAAYLVNRGHPYHRKPPQQAAPQGDCPGVLGWKWTGGQCAGVQGCGCVGPDCNHLYTSKLECEADHVSPRLASEPLPKPADGDGSTIWADNVGPIDAAAPDRASRFRYAGDAYMGGAQLAASGWHADGRSLGVLIRAICQTELLLPNAVASQLWNPQWWNREDSPFSNWSYGLGWYIRGNWVAWAGGAEGSMATVLHNRAYDFTVVYLTNANGEALPEFMDPLMEPVGQMWNTSPVGAAFPCMDDPQTAANECSLLIPPLTVPY